MKHETFRYHSSLDGTGPLLADVCWLPSDRRKPVLLVMHGYSGGREAVQQDLRDFAEQGAVAVAPDMRGGGESPGQFDSGGFDVHDAVDAAMWMVEHMPDIADPKNINIVGYSGGGGNAISAACRFPDLFNVAVSFFGIPHYAGWWADNTRPDCMKIMADTLGTPDDEPAVYEARNMIPAAGNAAATQWWLFWDSEETMCPPNCVDAWIDAYHEAGGSELHRSVTTPADDRRWIHGYRTSNPALRHADDLFMPQVLERPERNRFNLPLEGEFVVPGYLVTRHFSVRVDDGQRGRVRIRYDLSGDQPVVDVVDNPRGFEVEVTHKSLTAQV